MLNNLFSIFKTFYKILTNNNFVNNLTINNIKFNFRMCAALSFSHGLYALSTIKDRTIILKKKYKLTTNGYTNLM
jgi:hypothetical protein